MRLAADREDNADRRLCPKVSKEWLIHGESRRYGYPTPHWQLFTPPIFLDSQLVTSGVEGTVWRKSACG